MPPTDSARAHVDAQGIALEAVFTRDQRRLRVDYRIRNTGAVAIVVFDRGDRHAVLTRRQTAGAIGAPMQAQADGRATLSHVARALPRPVPTVAPTPLARWIAPGGTADASFEFANWMPDTPAQVQWCVGIGVADEARLFLPDDSGDTEVWQADFGYADDQQVLCTPWFDMARGTFDS